VRPVSAGIGDPVTADEIAAARARLAEPPTNELPRITATTPPPEQRGPAAESDATATRPDIPAVRSESPAGPDTVAGSATPVSEPGKTAPPAAQSGKPGKPSVRVPGLDGVRALAVLAVLGFHEGLPWIPGGFLGVDVFFVLSGYLITDLLVGRFSRDGKIGLGSFYQRRARRLLPALALVLITVTAAVSVLEPQQRAALRPALLGAITYTSNWWQAFAHQSYFALYGPPPPFQHLWSLAVEEQFYLIWPLIVTAVLVLIRRRRLRPFVAWAGAAASALAMLALYHPGADPSLVYYGTDTHATGLMVGAALALTWPLGKVATAARKFWLPLDLAGAAGLAVLGWAAWHLSGADPFVYPYGLCIAAVASGALVLAAAAPGRIGRALSAPPLRWLGIRSYGIYLWHWPVIAITVGVAERSAATVPARIIESLAPIGLAAASWRWLEEPILRNGLRSELARRRRLVVVAVTQGWRKPAALMPLGVATALLAVAGTAAYGIARPPSGSTLQQQIARNARIVANSNLPGAPGALPNQSDPQWIKVGDGPYRPPRTSGHPLPRRYAGSKVIAIGDSVMLASALGLEQELPGIYVNAQVSRAMIAGVAIVQQLARAKRLRQILIVGLGTNGPITTYQIEQLRAAIGDRWLLLVNTFVPRPWEQEVNATIAAAARRWPASTTRRSSRPWC